jgi:hypothetical protein
MNKILVAKDNLFNYNRHMQLPTLQLPWTSGERHVAAKNVQVDSSHNYSCILFTIIMDFSSLDVAPVIVGLCDYLCD